MGFAARIPSRTSELDASQGGSYVAYPLGV